jgi:hypothetical protein
MPESPKLDANADFMRWVLSVNQMEPQSDDALLAVDILLKHIGGYPRSLRAFWHESFGQWWIHPTGAPGHQVGNVTQAEVDRVRAERQAA